VLHSQHRDRASVADAHLVPGKCPRAGTARGTFQKGRSCLSGSSNGWPWAESAGSGRAGDLTGGSRDNVNGDDVVFTDGRAGGRAHGGDDPRG